MIEILLFIAIGLLTVLIVMVIVLLVIGGKAPQGGFDRDELRKLFEDGRISSLKDIQTSVTAQNQEIQRLKDGISASMAEAQKTNQTDLYKFLEDTQGKLTALQVNFTKESSDVKQTNLVSIQELIALTSKELYDLKTGIIKEINDANIKNNENVNERNLQTQDRIDSQIKTLKEEVQKSLDKGFEKNDAAIQDFIKKTAAIEASTRQLEELRKEIAVFNNLLSNQKTRGNFGEDVLEQIFVSIFGRKEGNPIYRTQLNLSKEFGLKQVKDDAGVKQDVIVDFVFNALTDRGVLPVSIDAKFPYANYLPLLDEKIGPETRKEARKLFKTDVTNRIREVEKYIIEGHTAPYAVMFVPAEAVFIDIFREFPEVVEDARKRRVIIASPSLIVTILQILQFILKDYQLRNNADKVLGLIDEIGKQFTLFSKRWEAHRDRVIIMVKDVKELDITAGKLTDDFEETKNLVKATSFAADVVEARQETTD